IFIALGYSERSGGSLYLGQCLIDDKGEMLWSRRKLKPTHVERTVFGEGYARDLIVSDTELGRVGALCCWEHLSPLSKYALYSQHEAIHIAAWPSFSLYSEQAHALSAKVNMLPRKSIRLKASALPSPPAVSSPRRHWTCWK